MKTVCQYRQEARECRELARQIQFRDAREQLLQLAKQWDADADEREASFLLIQSPPPDQEPTETPAWQAEDAPGGASPK
jgi:hypothetical protein